MKEIFTMKVFFDKINKFRTERGISVKGFAKLLDVSRTTLWKWENSLLTPSEETIKKIANVLNVSISDISDIPEPVQVSQHRFSAVVDSWLGLTEINNKTHQDQIGLVLDTIQSLNSKLNQSVLIIKALLDSMETMFYIKDSRLKYITANASFLNNVSYDLENPVLGRDDFVFFSQEEARENTEEDRKVFQTGEAVLRNERNIPGCRKSKWGIVSKLPVFDSDNKIVGVIGTFIDITERKKSEEMRILLENCVDTITSIISIHDINTDSYLYFNKRAIELMTGYPAEKLMGKAGRNFVLNKICHPEDRKILMGPKEKTKYPKTTCLHWRAIRADGEIRFMESIDSYIKYSGIDCIIGITSDITEKVRAEEKLKLLELNINAMSHIFSIYDMEEDKFLFLNKKMFERISGYPVEKMYAKNGRENFLVNTFTHPEDRHLHSKVKEVIEWPNTRTKEYRVIRGDGEIRWLETVDSYINYNNKTCIAGITHDITEKKETSEENNTLRQIIEKTQNVVWHGTTEDGLICNLKNFWISSNTEELFGKRDFKKDAVYYIHNLLEEYKKSYLKFINTPVEKEAKFEYQIYHQIKKEVRWLRVSVYRKDTTLFGIVTDITETR